MEYNFRAIEQRWQERWKTEGAYKVSNDTRKPKYYVLDMFPYPSGSGLHVGHPLGYIASDIFARYKRLKGFNVLHPMGYDAFGLPAEQYAIDHGIHPAVSTANNINTFRKQLDNIGFCYDWSREIRTCDTSYYRWTQWIFLQLFKSWYNRKTNRAEPIDRLVAFFEKEGNVNHPIPNFKSEISPADGGIKSQIFSASGWNGFDEATQQAILMEYRLAYCGYGEVNWCEALGTVLANDEVINGVSERGGFPVVKKKLRQWYLRITEYADRLQHDLDVLEWSDAMKEMQTNWIGKSSGAEIKFEISNLKFQIVAYTTRPDTIFGVDFMVLAPEHELVDHITTAEQKAAVEEYVAYVKSRSERERMAEKKISGCFTGAYVINPVNAKEIPVWISEYVLAGYGTGAIMAVPCGDERDHRFAKHFNIPITNIFGDLYTGEEAITGKHVTVYNSGFITGLKVSEAAEKVIEWLGDEGVGERKINYKMRDAAFSRQRYWGEPFPIVWKDGIAYPLEESALPLELPHVDSYKPGPEGEGPLANIKAWTEQHLETNTMPGYAGSSWYFLRYMDPHNDKTFCDRKVSDYWNQVDLYIGGTEHAVGHLLYSRMWTKVLYDLGHIGFNEPFKRLLNQGMIQGSSRFVYRVRGTNSFVSFGLIENYETDKIHVDVNIVDGVELDIEAFRKWRNAEYANAEFILEGDRYICGVEVEKMSKSKFNTVNPDDLVDRYGADTFRMYEMFLGPVEQSKPWDTKGIEGVHRFLKKLWRLFYDEQKGKLWTEENPSAEELKVLHRTIKKIEEDTEHFSFNTAVSAFMIAVNELTDLQCHKKAILENILVLLTPYAPHVAEELWHLLGNSGSVLDTAYPVFEEKYVTESSKLYPVAINGKTRTEIHIALDATPQQVEELVIANEIVQKWLEGKTPKKVIYVKNRMINVVV
ncbi:MAG: leucine--tRNA ligase [Chitinophagaceae bacterium]|nr:leucine--tRNA ligase [Chitinophagaceae bacterium]